jgi:hypothetical protein
MVDIEVEPANSASADGHRNLTLTVDLPLQEIVLEHRPDPELVIYAGNAGHGILSHRIVSPYKINTLQTKPGIDAGLAILDEHGAITWVRYRTTADPATMNGVTPD